MSKESEGENKVQHKYTHSRTVHYYDCGSCGKEISERDGDPDCFEELGPPSHEVVCPHCNTEADVSNLDD